MASILPSFLGTAQLTNAATTIVTAAATSTAWVVKKCILTNTDVAARTVTIYRVAVYQRRHALGDALG